MQSINLQLPKRLSQAIKSGVVTHKCHFKTFNQTHSQPWKLWRHLAAHQQLRHLQHLQRRMSTHKKGHFLVQMKSGKTRWLQRMACFPVSALTFPAASPGWTSRSKVSRVQHRKPKQHLNPSEQMLPLQTPHCLHTYGRIKEKNPQWFQK